MGHPIRRLWSEDSWRRIARALAEVETDPENWEAEFYAALGKVPSSRRAHLGGSGDGRSVTLFNCFVMDDIGDDRRASSPR